MTSGVNPAGFQVFAFKRPSTEELDHDYLWRTTVRLPERGRIGVFNRSYYEEVLVVRVHPQILEGQRLPREVRRGNVWRQRFASIRDHERHLARNGYVIIKFFLNVLTIDVGSSPCLSAVIVCSSGPSAASDSNQRHESSDISINSPDSNKQGSCVSQLTGQ